MGDNSLGPFIDDFNYVPEISFHICFVETSYNVRILNSDKNLALFSYICKGDIFIFYFLYFYLHSVYGVCHSIALFDLRM